jgi:RimJ/RimL family protein N-acetyltransferase
MKLLPYTSIDGIPTFKDSDIVQMYHWMKKDRTLKTVFYNVDSELLTEIFFIRFWKRQDLKMFVVLSENRVAGLIWLDRIIDSTAMIHINSFKWIWGRSSVSVFRRATCEILTKHGIDVLIGQIPITNEKAIKFSEKVGFLKCGIIPKSLYIHLLDKKVDAFVSYACKDRFLIPDQGQHRTSPDRPTRRISPNSY